VKKRIWRRLVCIVFFFPLFFSIGIPGAQSPSSGPGISEKTAADTVDIQSTSGVETIRIRNSRTDDIHDTAVLKSSGETVIDMDRTRNPDFMNQTPLIRPSSTGRVKSMRKIISGAALFGVSYGISFIVASTMYSESVGPEGTTLATCFYVPVAGPVLAEIASSPSSEFVVPVTMLCLGWAAAQGIGLTLLISGLVGTPAKNNLSALPLSIEPLVMRDKAGLTVRMRFDPSF
jgi:hypothetical protein